MVPTTEEALEEMFLEAIVGITPRVQYQGAESWAPYDKEVGNPSRTRRFRLVFGTPRLRQGVGSVMSGNAFAHEVEVRVRTDYAGVHSRLQFLIADDFMHLRDVLSGLKANNNGLMLVEPIDTYVDGTFRPIQLVESSDVKKVDHTYRVRFLRSIAP